MADMAVAEKKAVVDYYKVLECDRKASVEEIKKNYKRLILSTHPDKMENQSDSFHLIQEAWKVLQDPESRKRYDAELRFDEHNGVLLYDIIKLSHMGFEDGMYTFNCRCGGMYLLEPSWCNSTRNVIVGCEECSFSIQVTMK